MLKMKKALKENKYPLERYTSENDFKQELLNAFHEAEKVYFYQIQIKKLVEKGMSEDEAQRTTLDNIAYILERNGGTAHKRWIIAIPEIESFFRRSTGNTQHKE